MSARYQSGNHTVSSSECMLPCSGTPVPEGNPPPYYCLRTGLALKLVLHLPALLLITLSLLYSAAPAVSRQEQSSSSSLLSHANRPPTSQLFPTTALRYCQAADLQRREHSASWTTGVYRIRTPSLFDWLADSPIELSPVVVATEAAL